jgi:hypothetical protein
VHKHDYVVFRFRKSAYLRYTRMAASLETTANSLCDKTCRVHGSENSYNGLVVDDAVWVPSLEAICCFECEQQTDNMSAASSLNSIQTICVLLPV